MKSVLNNAYIVWEIPFYHENTIGHVCHADLLSQNEKITYKKSTKL